MFKTLLSAVGRIFQGRSCEGYYNALVAKDPLVAPTVEQACQDYRSTRQNKAIDYILFG